MWDKIWCQLEGMWRFWAIIGIKTQNWISPRHSQDKSRHSTLNSSNSESKRWNQGPEESPKWDWKLIISFKLKFCENEHIYFGYNSWNIAFTNFYNLPFYWKFYVDVKNGKKLWNRFITKGEMMCFTSLSTYIV